MLHLENNIRIIEMANQNKQNSTYVGSLFIPTGHTLWKMNTKTFEIAPKNITYIQPTKPQKIDYIDFVLGFGSKGNAPTEKFKCEVANDEWYVVALNKKNAVKKIMRIAEKNNKTATKEELKSLEDYLLVCNGLLKKKK